MILVAIAAVPTAVAVVAALRLTGSGRRATTEAANARRRDFFGDREPAAH